MYRILRGRENPEKQVSLGNSGSLPLEQPWKPDLLRRNSRKDGLPEKQTSSVATGSYNKQPVEKKTKPQKTKKQDRGCPTKGILFLSGWSSSIWSLQDSTYSSWLKQHSRKRKDGLWNRGFDKKKKRVWEAARFDPLSERDKSIYKEHLFEENHPGQTPSFRKHWVGLS